MYTFSLNGVEIAATYDTEQPRGMQEYAYLPRFGWKMRLAQTFDKLNYFAYGSEIGNGESYADLYEYAVKKEYQTDVKNEYYPYAKPQESGSHYGTEYASLSNGEHHVAVYGSFSFSAIPYSTQDLRRAKHDYELPAWEKTYLSVDGFMRGVGSNSCGPALSEEYQVPDRGEFSFFVAL